MSDPLLPSASLHPPPIEWCETGEAVLPVELEGRIHTTDLVRRLRGSGGVEPDGPRSLGGAIPIVRDAGYGHGPGTLAIKPHLRGINPMGQPRTILAAIQGGSNAG